MKQEDFARVVDEALKGLPPKVRARVTEIPVVIKDRPTAREIRDADLPPGDALLGLFSGTSLRDKTTWGEPGGMDRIILYRKPLEETCASRKELILEIQKTVIHEVGHFLGMEEEDLERLGYD